MDEFGKEKPKKERMAEGEREKQRNIRVPRESSCQSQDEGGPSVWVGDGQQGGRKRVRC